MRILFLTLGNELVASSRTRVFQYLPHLERLGATTCVIEYQSGADYWWSARVSPGNALTRAVFLAGIGAIRAYHFFTGRRALRKLVAEARHHDIVFVQKVVLPLRVLDALSEIGVPVVFDFDDAIYVNDSYDVDAVRRIIRKACLAVVENEETETFAKEVGTAALRITGPIDCRRYRPAMRNGGNDIVLGWVGSGSTTSYLLELADPLRRLCQQHANLRLRLIGAGPIDLPGVIVERFSWSLETEPALLANCHIGMMPLPDTSWARGKGGYKLLQYMATGLPSICSPIGINSEIVIDGVTGLHASSPDAWYHAVDKLIRDTALRERMGAAARCRAEQDYSFEAATPKLFAAMRAIRSDRESAVKNSSR